MSAELSSFQGIRGWLFDTPTRGTLRARADGGVIVDEAGKIVAVGDHAGLAEEERWAGVRWRHSGRVAVFPGLMDLHSHVPQYPAIARGTSELLPWLRRHIFPREKVFVGERAQRESRQFFQELARHGTTMAMVYTAVYEESCEAAFVAAQAVGLRAIAGKMMMDVGSYGALPPRQILGQSLAESERLCQKWHGAEDGLLHYAFSPRFALSCSEAMMRGAGELAAQYGAYVETHLAENLGELAAVRELFPEARDYTEVYERCGLLGRRTVLGHCIHLSEREIAVLAERGCVAAHCPTANFFLSSGMMRLDALVGAGVRVGLGTDVGAGLELNLWQVMRTVIEGQKARSFYEPAVAIPMPAEALFHATQGAAEALGWGEKLGTLEVGKEADMTVMDYEALLPYASAESAGELSAEDVLSLCVYRGGPGAVLETVVRGRSVYRAN